MSPLNTNKKRAIMYLAYDMLKMVGFGYANTRDKM